MPLKGLIILFMLALIVGTLPVWPHSRRLGFYPSGGLSLCLMSFIALILFHVI